MKKELFRKDVVDRITAPEQLRDYIKVVKPGVWCIITGVFLAIISMVAFLAYSDMKIYTLFFG